jgi:hypothetical protein
MFDKSKLLIDISIFVEENFRPKSRIRNSLLMDSLEIMSEKCDSCLDNLDIEESKIYPYSAEDIKSNEIQYKINGLSGLGSYLNDNKSETFNVLLLRHLDTKGYLKDSDFYKKANIDRRLFSRLKNSDYHPSQKTSIALALALELSLEDTELLLASAGYALSMSSKFDLVIQYCIVNRIFDFFVINECLDSLGLKTLGGE